MRSSCGAALDEVSTTGEKGTAFENHRHCEGAPATVAIRVFPAPMGPGGALRRRGYGLPRPDGARNDVVIFGGSFCFGGAGVAGASCGTVDARSLHWSPVGRSVWKSDLLRAPDLGFACQDIQVIGVILFQQIGGIQAVGAPGGALAAFQAVGDLVHLLLGGGGEPAGSGGAAEHQGHSRAVVDLDAHGTGHAVAAAPAEFAQKLLPVMFDQRGQLRRQRGGIVDVA